MCSPSPPPPPDYAGAAREQGAANVDAARTQGRINNPNVVNPYGNQTVTWDGDTPTLTQTLSPEQQRLYMQNVETQRLLGQLGQQGAQSLFGVVGKPVDFSNAAQAGGVYRPSGGLTVLPPPASLDSASLGRMPTAYAGAQNLPDMPQASGEIRDRVINAMMTRANEGFDQQQEQNNADLVARGLTPGSKGYEAEMDRLNRQRTDYRLQAELAGGEEANRAFGQDMSRRQQGYSEQTNDAQLMYDQLMGIRQQGQGEQGQRFEQQLSGDAQRFSQLGQATELGMREQGQQNSQANELRRSQIAEYLAQRQTPLNEISALMSGSQVTNPFNVPNYAQNSSVAPAPIFGATQAAGQYGTDVHNANTASRNSTTGAIGSMAAMAAMFF